MPEQASAATIVPYPPSTFDWEPGDVEHDIAVLMSGGVDSSVTAALLQQQGWRVLGITMRIPALAAGQHPAPCCDTGAAEVSARLGISHYYLDSDAAFRQCVIEPFQRAYASGRTPNPCTDCNKRLKFGMVWDVIEREFGVRHVATGHYTRVVRGAAGPVRLAPGADPARDQSYFLYGIRPDRLPYFHAPLADLSKTEVRTYAAKLGLKVAERPDSMELCFAGDGDYRQALSRDFTDKPGLICDQSGRELGRHRGIRYYTVGQRRGLGLGGGPYYVLQIEPAANRLIVGTKAQAYCQEVVAVKPNVLAPELLQVGSVFQGKLRSCSAPEPCRLIGADAAGFTVQYDQPVFAPAPGQHLVLYGEDGCVVAGGEIR